MRLCHGSPGPVELYGKGISGGSDSGPIWSSPVPAHTLLALGHLILTGDDEQCVWLDPEGWMARLFAGQNMEGGGEGGAGGSREALEGGSGRARFRSVLSPGLPVAGPAALGCSRCTSSAGSDSESFGES